MAKVVIIPSPKSLSSPWSQMRPRRVLTDTLRTDRIRNSEKASFCAVGSDGTGK